MPPSTSKSHSVLVRIPDSLYEVLSAVAHSTGLGMSTLVRMELMELYEKSIQEYEKTHKKEAKP